MKELFDRIVASAVFKAEVDFETVNQQAVSLVNELRSALGEVGLYRPVFLLDAPKGAQDVVHVSTPNGEYSFYDCGLSGYKTTFKANGSEKAEFLPGNSFYEFHLFRRAVSRVWN